jgi:NAD(P)H-nitrite reductase large subunit
MGPLSEPGEEIICQCYLTTRRAVYEAVVEHELRSCYAVGRRLGAGLGCRACRFERRGIRDIVREVWGECED